MRPLSEEFGINVRNRRKELKISQDELAYRAGVNRTTIIGIESGNCNPTLINIATIAEALKVHPSELLKTD